MGQISIEIDTGNKLRYLWLPGGALCLYHVLATTIVYLQGNARLEKVVFCLFGKESLMAFAKELESQLQCCKDSTSSF
jgi:hypothetical protein